MSVKNWIYQYKKSSQNREDFLYYFDSTYTPTIDFDFSIQEINVEATVSCSS